jgi:hypothetical protein
VDVVYGAHWLVANLRAVVLFPVRLPKAVSLTRAAEIPRRAAFGLAYRGVTRDYWHRRVRWEACGCLAFRGHIKGYDVECAEHWGFDDDDDLDLDDSDGVDGLDADRPG